MRTWTRLIPAVLLILPFPPAFLRAAEDATSLTDKLNQLSKKVETLEKNVTDNSVRRNQVEAELRNIRVELAKIRELLEHMAQQGVIRREAGYDPRFVPGVPGGAIPTTGTITLQNVFSAPATVRINDQSYFVGPNETRTVRLPFGSFQYSVDVEGFGMVEPPHMETLRPPGFRIRIFLKMPF